MNTKIISCILFIILLSACGGAGNSPTPQNTRMSRLEVEQTSPVNKIEIIASKTKLNRGENGVIVIRGNPGITYTISSNYTAGGKTLKATEHETAGPDGIVTWTWFVTRTTAPGTYPIEITGGGNHLRTSFTVNQ
ncbi:MAG: hypothetical protein N2484_12970 [Clostridia bacterium]|nr:hypothetical protein [Clostridia bacterium]